jgi:quercetin dioxygenase-like cupin family protein
MHFDPIVPGLPLAEPVEPAIPEAPCEAFAIDMAQVPEERWSDPSHGTVAWRTLICGDRTPSLGLVSGVALLEAGGTLNPHRHTPPEVYFGIEGSGTVTIDGVPMILTPGVAIYVPANAEHGTVAGPEGLKFFYTFGVDRFADVDYRFSADLPV